MEAFQTFLASCGALAKPPAEIGPTSNPALLPGLRHACTAARALGTPTPSAAIARLFFEANFQPWRIAPAQNPPGFLTGYYEPEVDGSPVRTDTFTVPVYGRPDDLIPTSPPKDSNRGGAQRKQWGTLVPYYDRGEIEDGALRGRGLEIAWLQHPVDLFFMQIQGSARIRLPDGHVLRLNYDGHNGYPYTPVGRLLIQRGLVPRDEMSMDRIRRFIEQDPEAGRALMRENRSFVFFKAVPLEGDAGALGAEGVPLTAGRSIAVDRAIHTYGAPIFIAADLPLDTADALAPFRQLMIAQDTGSAIVGPARADLFFGAGDGPGAVAGRIRHPGAFTLLVPRLAGTNP
ncbi:MltA domain-containing protein [Aquabacter sp. CN5-332]|uniref:murein transglycosylase A n=1 Tax=Aquabacter sp. CN5-332 TaxID=3156608 RepID=UPI0032B61444